MKFKHLLNLMSHYQAECLYTHLTFFFPFSLTQWCLKLTMTGAHRCLCCLFCLVFFFFCRDCVLLYILGLVFVMYVYTVSVFISVADLAVIAYDMGLHLTRLNAFWVTPHALCSMPSFDSYYNVAF